VIGRLMARVLDAQGGWARPFGDAIHDVLHAVFHRLTPVRDVLNGRWLGHPLHALLTDVPIGVLTLVIILDVLGVPVGADVALVVGVLALAGAALAGLADYADTDGRARVRATIHGTLMTIALVLYLVSLAMRAAGGQRAVPIAVSIVAYLILAAGAYVGGDVVYLLGNMVDRHAWRPAGAKWALLEVGDVPEDQPVKAKFGLQALVLVRHGDRIQALHEQCAHAGGPLSQGTLVDGCLECPWHGSRFRLSDGHVVRGPSVYDQPAYEVRAVEGGGHEARRIA